MRLSRTIPPPKLTEKPPLPANVDSRERKQAGDVLQSVLRGLDRAGLQHLAGGLRLEGHRLLRERVDALALLGGGLLHDDELREPGEHEQTVLLQLLVADCGQRLEDAGDVLARQLVLVSVSDSLDDLRLRQNLRHCRSPFFRSSMRRQTCDRKFVADSKEKDRRAKQKTA